MKEKSKYLSSAFLMLTTSVLVKVIGAVYKIPLTAFIGAVGRGCFATAYNLYLPVHAVLLGALPIAMSRLVSRYRAAGDRRMLASLKRGAGQLFFLAGAAGMLLLMLAAKPYAAWISGAPKSLYTVLVLAPSLLFSCLSGCYRGYYEGFMNMKPTAVSQTLEALLKMVLGLVSARAAMAMLYDNYLNTGTVLGKPADSEAQAFSMIYPYTAAAAMLGVTAGSLFSLLYLIIYDATGNRRNRLRVSAAEGRRALLSFALPIMISGAVQSIFQFLDTASVQYALGKVGGEAIKNAYAYGIHTVGVTDGDLTAYAFGLFSAALDFRNLIPGVTMAVGVCAVPAICREYEQKHPQELKRLVNTVFRLTTVISVAGGFFIALASRELLSLFYASSAPDIVEGCNEIVKYFALSVPVYALASTAVFCVQAVGKPEKSVLPYVLSGVIRVALNLLLIQNKSYLLFGAVIAGAVGYTVLFVMNFRIVRKTAKVKISRMRCVIMPVLCGFAALFVTKYSIAQLSLVKNAVFNLLIEFVVFCGIYCILCFFFKVLNFKEIFCGFNRKKMA